MTSISALNNMDTIHDLKGKGKAREFDNNPDKEKHEEPTSTGFHEVGGQNPSVGSLQRVAESDQVYGQQDYFSESLASITMMEPFACSTMPPCELMRQIAKSGKHSSTQPHSHNAYDPLCTSCISLLSHLHQPLTSPFTHLLSKTTRHIPRTTSEEHSIHTVISTGLSRITEIEQAEIKLKALMDDLKREKKKVEAWVDDHRVMIAPVWTLPPEVLSEIFMQVVGFDDGSWDEIEYSTVPSSDSDATYSVPSSTSGTNPSSHDREREKRAKGEITRTSMRSSVRLSWVCRQWRDVALHTPQLWTRICVVELPPPQEIGEIRKLLGLDDGIVNSTGGGSDAAGAKPSRRSMAIEALESNFASTFGFTMSPPNSDPSSEVTLPSSNTISTSSSSKLPMPLIALLRTGTSLPLDLHFKTSKPRDIIDYFLPVKSRWRRVVFDASVGVGVMMRVLSGEVHVGEVDARRRRGEGVDGDMERWRDVVDSRGELRRIAIDEGSVERDSEDEMSESQDVAGGSSMSRGVVGEGSSTSYAGYSREKEREVRFPMLQSLEFRGVPTAELRETGWVVGEIWRPPASVLAAGGLTTTLTTVPNNVPHPTLGPVAAPMPAPIPTPAPALAPAPVQPPPNTTLDVPSSSTAPTTALANDEGDADPAASGPSATVSNSEDSTEAVQQVEEDGNGNTTNSGENVNATSDDDDTTPMGTSNTAEVISTSSSTGSAGAVDTSGPSAGSGGAQVSGGSGESWGDVVDGPSTQQETTSEATAATATATASGSGSGAFGEATSSVATSTDLVAVPPAPAPSPATSTPIPNSSAPVIRTHSIAHPKLNPLSLFTTYHAPNLTSLCSVQMFGIAYTTLPLSLLRRYEGPVQVGDYARLLSMMPVLEELFVQPLRSAGGGFVMAGLGGGVGQGGQQPQAQPQQQPPQPQQQQQAQQQQQQQQQVQGPAAGAAGPPPPAGGINAVLATLLEPESPPSTPPHLHLRHLHISSSSIASTLSFSLMAGGGGPPWLLTQLQHLPPLPSLTKLFLYFDKRFIPPQPERTLYPFFERNGAGLREVVWGLSLGVESVKRCLERCGGLEVLHVHRICGDSLLKALVVEEERVLVRGARGGGATTTTTTMNQGPLRTRNGDDGNDNITVGEMMSIIARELGPGGMFDRTAGQGGTSAGAGDVASGSGTGIGTGEGSGVSDGVGEVPGTSLEVGGSDAVVVDQTVTTPQSVSDTPDPVVAGESAETANIGDTDADADANGQEEVVGDGVVVDSSVGGGDDGSGSTSANLNINTSSLTTSLMIGPEIVGVVPSDQPPTSTSPSPSPALSPPATMTMNSTPATMMVDSTPATMTMNPTPTTTTTTNSTPATTTTEQPVRPILLPNLRVLRVSGKIVLRVEMLEKLVWSRCEGGRDGRMRNVNRLEQGIHNRNAMGGSMDMKRDVKGKGKARDVGGEGSGGGGGVSGSGSGSGGDSGDSETNHLRSRSGSDDAGSDEDKIRGGERVEDTQSVPWLLRGISMARFSQTTGDVVQGDAAQTSTTQTSTTTTATTTTTQPATSQISPQSTSNVQSNSDGSGAQSQIVRPRNTRALRELHFLPARLEKLDSKSRDRIAKMGGDRTGMVVVVRQLDRAAFLSRRF